MTNLEKLQDIGIESLCLTMASNNDSQDKGCCILDLIEGKTCACVGDTCLACVLNYLYSDEDEPLDIIPDE